ncbi:polyphenol oxidase family protein [Marinilactibacillus kalidii]|uniref:polyphenol oxidase family protein n=1 Tax=Marinilactibacillus kalidii TaxID=2820274 RepID=UPI001FC99E53|nr:polyphenol oxidase family protein [Marinilactibacillus kalidii]
MSQMKSILLEKNGLLNRVAGTGYDFRYQRAGQKVVEDVDRLLTTLNIKPIEIYSGQQTHSANVIYVDGGNGEDFAYGKTFENTDGLITDRKDIAFLIKFADCTPVVLYDPVKGVQASVHSGWRGTTKKISLNAIEQMVDQFGCRKENILVYLGPSIGREHYEVGPEVYEAFESFQSRDQFFEPIGEKFLLSMLDANEAILIEAGILPKNIDKEETSTFSDNRLHSARGEGTDYKLNGIITMMPSNK